MIKLGINEFVRNFRRNILVIFQLAAVMVLLVLLVSTYNVQTKLGFAVLKYIDDTAIYTYVDGFMDNLNPITRNLEGVENVVYSRRTKGINLVNEEGESIGMCEFSAYDENIVDYRPRLKSGVWYCEAPKEEGTINVVVAENTFGYETGDIVEMKAVDSANREHNLKCKIVGTVYKDTMLFGMSNFYTTINCSYLDLFASAADNQPEMDEEVLTEMPTTPYLYGVMSEADMKEYHIWSVIKNVLVDFDDNLSEEQMDSNLKQMERSGSSQITDLMNENSKILLFQKIGGIVILLIVLIALSVVSIISSSEVNFIYERRNYGIYFITGNNWMKTMVLAAVNWICVIIFSIMLSLTGISAIVVSGASKHLTIIWAREHILSYMAVAVVTMIIALIIPAVLLKKSQPVEILKNV